MKIITNPEVLRNNATQIRNEKAKFDETIARIKAIANSMGGEFEGGAATAFVNNIESHSPTFVQIGELIETFAKKLDVTAQTMEETDKALESQNNQ